MFSGCRNLLVLHINGCTDYTRSLLEQLFPQKGIINHMYSILTFNDIYYINDRCIHPDFYLLAILLFDIKNQQ